LNGRECLIVNLKRIEYEKAWRLQKKIFQAKLRKKLDEDVLLLLEHPHTITVGRKGKRDEILIDHERLKKEGVSIFYIERGGRVTYHGPGQLVGYPILGLNCYRKDLHLYLRYLEEVLIKTLREFKIGAGRINDFTGVWVGRKKIASIGIKVRRWVTLHGFALNINTELDYFNLIQPCGMEAQIMTSMKSLLNKDIKLKEVVGKLIPRFSDVFGVKMREISLLDLQKRFIDLDTNGSSIYC